MESPSKDYPLMLVCYINTEVITDNSVMNEIVENFNSALAHREANAMAFFVPTDGEERIECINPVIATPEQLTNIDVLITELKNRFDIDTVKQNNDEN